MLGVTLIFATDLHHLVIAALNDSYTIFQPGEIAAHRRRRAARDPDRRDGLPDRHPALGAVSGVRPAVQSRPRRAVAADAADAGVLRRRAAVDPARLPDPAARDRRDDGYLPRLPRTAFSPTLLHASDEGLAWPTNPDEFDKTEDPTQKRLDDALKRGDVVKSQEVNTWFVIAGATLVLMAFSGADEQRPHHHDARLIANSYRYQRRRPGLAAAVQKIGVEMLAAIAIPLLRSDAGRDRRQHDPAPPGVVRSKR